MNRQTASIAIAAALLALPAGGYAAQPGTSLESDFLDQLSDWLMGQVASAAALLVDGACPGQDGSADPGREGSAVDPTGFTGPIIVPPNEGFTGPIIVPPGEGQL
jgi:hypothetical protein